MLNVLCWELWYGKLVIKYQNNKAWHTKKSPNQQYSSHFYIPFSTAIFDVKRTFFLGLAEKNLYKDKQINIKKVFNIFILWSCHI